MAKNVYLQPNAPDPIHSADVILALNMCLTPAHSPLASTNRAERLARTVWTTISL